MAKSSKTKTNPVTPEVPSGEAVETSETTVTSNDEQVEVKEPVIEPDEKVEEVEIVTPSKDPVPAEPAPIVVSEKLQEYTKPAVRPEMNPNLSKEERLNAYLENRSGVVRMNDFLKSLYPIPKNNEPALWKNQGEMKQLRMILENMQVAGKINVVNDTHRLLGKHYYAGEGQVQTHHNLGTVTIELYVTG